MAQKKVVSPADKKKAVLKDKIKAVNENAKKVCKTTKDKAATKVDELKKKIAAIKPVPKKTAAAPAPKKTAAAAPAPKKTVAAAPKKSAPTKKATPSPKVVQEKQHQSIFAQFQVE